MHRGVLEALAYAKSMRPNRLLAVTVVSDEDEQEKIARDWAHFGIDVPLEIVFSPYRELARPGAAVRRGARRPAVATTSSPS